MDVFFVRQLFYTSVQIEIGPARFVIERLNIRPLHRPRPSRSKRLEHGLFCGKAGSEVLVFIFSSVAVGDLIFRVDFL